MMCYLRKAWNSVTVKVIENCFRYRDFMYQSRNKVPEMKETEREGLIKEAEKRYLVHSFVCELCSN